MLNYIKVIEEGLRHSRSVMCRTCGSHTPIYGNEGICYNCENLIVTERDSLIMGDELARMLDSYNKKIMDGDYADAISEYESLLKKYDMPQYLYMNGINYLKYSNYKVSQIRYDRAGFMEENSDYKKESIDLFSQARLFFNKTITAAKQSLPEKDIASDSALYLIFLSYMKLDDFRGGEYYLKKLMNLNNFLSDYSEIIFDSAIENYDSILKKCDLMLKKGEFTFTLFYYVAFALFKKRRYKKAQNILAALSKIIPNSSIDTLLDEIALL